LQPLLPRYRLQKLIELRRYSNPHAWFIALSKMVQKDMHHFYPLETERVHVIYNGVDTRRFSHRNRQQDRIALRKEWNIANDEVVLLIVAHNFALKGLRTVIESVALLNQRRLPVHLMVVGKDRIRPYRRRADQLGCLDRIHFLGSLGDTASCFAAADIYVHPTYYDPCSLVVLEALAMGLPVITSRFNGAGELITPGQQGYLVQNPSDSAELAAAILPLLQPEVRNEMSLAAHKLAQNHSHENNYHQILSARKHGPTSSLPNIPGRSVSKTG
jgi:UDP-glucose:(heptosyl)LPS alpha-1,3-glucosyltransferase